MKRLMIILSLPMLMAWGSYSHAQIMALPPMTPLAQMPAGEYQLDKTHASVTWRVGHLGLSRYTARFTKIDATLVMDVKNPAKSELTAIVYPNSIATDFPFAAETDFDQVLATGKEWFNADRFPEIRFTSKRIEITGSNTGKMHGELTMLGKTRPLSLNVKFNGAYQKKLLTDVPALGFSASATLKRSDWGLTAFIPVVSDDVDIAIEVEFDKAR